MSLTFTQEEANAVVVAELSKLRERIVTNMVQQKAVASGRTIASLKVVPYENGGALVSEQQMPFGVLETGRKGGKVPYGFAKIIEKWMQDKGIKGTIKGRQTQEQANKKMAYAIARTIALGGTKLFRDGGRNNIYSTEIPRTVADIELKVAARFEAFVDESIKINEKVEIGGKE